MRKKYLLILILILASFLRLWKLSEVPVSLFGDELDVGYHAYSISQTGRDYYGNFMPLHFHSLAEWRTPLYLYSAVPTVATFGISPLGVRLPAAIFGILGVWGLYLFVKKVFKNEKIAVLSAFFLSLSPWHIQYSRAAFEVTQLIAFLLFGLYFFFSALENKGKKLWVSALFLTLMPWVYSSAKLFTPFLMLLLFVIWFKKIVNIQKKNLILAAITGLIIGLPLVYSVFWGGAAQRFSYISVMTNPSTEHEVGVARLHDGMYRQSQGGELSLKLKDRLFHNKYTFWANDIVNNYFDSFSSDFLFYEGDRNLRHSPAGVGQFYPVEALALLLGLVFYFSGSNVDLQRKAFLAGWLILSVIPSAITREGGTHATRLILMLPPLIILISWGVSKIKNKLLLLGYVGFFILGLVFYQHNYWVHYPWNSERWWHAGFEQSFDYVKQHEDNYQNIVISTAKEPPWIFFAAWYQYPPSDWQANFPIENKTALEGYGDVSYIDKFYFGSPQKGVFSWSEIIDSSTLYLASATEVPMNLILEPDRVPPGLVLKHAVAYPSGEPAFYLFTGRDADE